MNIRFSQAVVRTLIRLNRNHPSTDQLVAFLLGIPGQAITGQDHRAKALRRDIKNVRHAA